MAAPGIAAFGDGSHAPGATGVAVQGGGFGAFPGHIWIYQNADRTGNADELTVTAWNGVEATVTIPGSLSNTAGTRYLFLQRSDLAWSNAFAFTLEAGAGINGSLSKTLATLTSSAAGALAITGSVVKTLGNATLSAIGAQNNTGTTVATLQAASLSAVGALAITGSVTKTLANVGHSIQGDLEAGINGVVSVTLGSVTCTAEGDLRIAGSVNRTLGDVTLSTRRSGNVTTARVYRAPRRNIHRAA